MSGKQARLQKERAHAPHRKSDRVSAERSRATCSLPEGNACLGLYPARLPPRSPPPLPPDSLGGRGATLVARRMAPLRGKRGGVEVRVARLRFKAEGGESMCINPPPFHPTRVARYEKLNMAAAIKTPLYK